MSPKIKLLAIAFVCVLPILASYSIFYLWQPHRAPHTVGELLETKDFPLPVLKLATAENFNIKTLRGHWLLLTVDSGTCGAACQDKLFMMRQLRLAQEKQMNRIERVWLLDDQIKPNAAIVHDMTGLHIVHAVSNDQAWLNALPIAEGAKAQDYIYLIDPFGNQVMRYRYQANPEEAVKILREITKILKNNQRIG